MIVKTYQELYELIDNMQMNRKKDRFVVTITGNSRTGKSTLEQVLSNYFISKGHKVQTFHLDDWILPKSERKSNMNVFNRFQIERLNNDFKLLFKGESIQMQPYDSFTRELSEISYYIGMQKRGIIIIEGVVSGFIDSIDSDCSIYIDIEEEIRKSRLELFYQNKGLSNGEISELYKKRLHDEVSLIEEFKKKADIIFKMEG